MSFNINNIQVLKIENLTVSLDLLRQGVVNRDSWTGKVKYHLPCEDCICFSGTVIEGDRLSISSLTVGVETTTTDYSDILIPILKASSGLLITIEIWGEGEGLYVNKFKDGQITEYHVVDLIDMDKIK